MSGDMQLELWLHEYKMVALSAVLEEQGSSVAIMMAVWVIGQTIVRLLTRLNRLLLTTSAGRRPLCSWLAWGSKSR